MLVCRDCKSKKLQQLVWIDPNTGEYKGDVSPEKEDNFWCETCESHTQVERKE